MRVYTVSLADSDRKEVLVEADSVMVEGTEAATAYFVLLDEDGAVVAAIPFQNVRSIISHDHFSSAGW